MASEFKIPDLRIPAFSEHVTRLREFLSLVTVSANMPQHLKRAYLETDDVFCAAARMVRLAWRSYQLRPGANSQGVIVIGWSLQSLLSRTGDPKTWKMFQEKIWKRYAVREGSDKSSFAFLQRAIFQNKDRGTEVELSTDLSIAEYALLMDPVDVKKRDPNWPKRIQKIILDPRSGANAIFAIFAATRMGVRGGRLLTDAAFGEGYVYQAADILTEVLADCAEDRVRSIHYLAALAWILICHCTGYREGMPVKKIRMLVQRVVLASQVEEKGKLTDNETAETIIVHKGTVLLTIFDANAMNHALLASAGIMCYIAFVNIDAPSAGSVIAELDNSGFDRKYLLPNPSSGEEYNVAADDLEIEEMIDSAAKDLKNLRVNPDCKIEDEEPPRAESPDLVPFPVERKKPDDAMQDDLFDFPASLDEILFKNAVMVVPPPAEVKAGNEPERSGKDEKMTLHKKRGADAPAETGSASKRAKTDLSEYQRKPANDNKNSSADVYADMPRLEPGSSSSSSKAGSVDLDAIFPPRVDLPNGISFPETTKRLIQLGYSNRADIAKAVDKTEGKLGNAAVWLRANSNAELRAIGHINTGGKNMKRIDDDGYDLFAPTAILKLLESEAHIEDKKQRLDSVLAILAKVKSQQKKKKAEVKQDAVMVVPVAAAEPMDLGNAPVMDLGNNDDAPAISTTCEAKNREASEAKVENFIHIVLPHPLEVRLKADSVAAMQEEVSASETVTIYRDNDPEASGGMTTVQYAKWSQRMARFVTLFGVHRQPHADLLLIRFDKQLTETSPERKFVLAVACLVHKLVLRALGSKQSIPESEFVQWLAQAAASKLNVTSNLANESPLNYCIECSGSDAELQHLRPVLKVRADEEEGKGVQCSWHDSSGVIGLWILIGRLGAKKPDDFKGPNLTQEKLTASGRTREYTIYAKLAKNFDGPFFPDYAKVLNKQAT